MPLVYLYKCNVLFRYLNMSEWGTIVSVLHYSFPPNIHIMSTLTCIPHLAVSTNPVSVFHVRFQLHNIYKTSAWFSHGCLSERQGACFSQCLFSLVWHATIALLNAKTVRQPSVMYFIWLVLWCISCLWCQIWTDEFLVWDPEEFDGITEISLSSDAIWVPDLIISEL